VRVRRVHLRKRMKRYKGIDKGQFSHGISGFGQCSPDHHHPPNPDEHPLSSFIPPNPRTSQHSITPFGALALSFWEGSGIFVRGSGQEGGVVDIARYERFLGTRRLEWRH